MSRNPKTPTAKTGAATAQITLWLPLPLLERIEEERKKCRPEVLGSAVSRTEIMRIAMTKGLEVMKSERHTKKEGNAT